ncbi:hypothetical protein CAI21_00035 [Alkalilimnicola ehrlichii]|uniref:Outer membrane protein beta-barrel domain-containing protein n=1 Tax=Alkalilimnicola ehrlichii TaxID=351052 RepID=A0A3E0X437_9GAMM|nr:outer membrane beta-barrel protein [Alkalilimnicola ehrlichii]RFA31100.1 hypothetical protein CAI21_00035 [Alkalilimnicola ehrlichii]RFA39612.1 hypothetical protein CAL65_02370 [Alkalilimnicola ehrlichii]
MKKKSLAALLTCAALSTPATALAVQMTDFYAGGGITRNQLSGWDDATGFQFFGGYNLPVETGLVDLSVELGYADSGDFESNGQETNADGLWLTGVARYPVTPEFGILGRLGADFGDDDGLMFGIGAGYRVNVAFEIRGEYVVRDETDSLQANFVVHF